MNDWIENKCQTDNLSKSFFLSLLISPPSPPSFFSLKKNVYSILIWKFGFASLVCVCVLCLVLFALEMKPLSNRSCFPLTWWRDSFFFKVQIDTKSKSFSFDAQEQTTTRREKKTVVKCFFQCCCWRFCLENCYKIDDF